MRKRESSEWLTHFVEKNSSLYRQTISLQLIDFRAREFFSFSCNVWSLGMLVVIEREKGVDQRFGRTNYQSPIRLIGDETSTVTITNISNAIDFSQCLEKRAGNEEMVEAHVLRRRPVDEKRAGRMGAAGPVSVDDVWPPCARCT